MKRNGFTLIELLVVIVIIMILSIVTTAQFQGARRKANDVARKGDLNAVTKSLAMYFSDYGYYPDPDLIDTKWGQSFTDPTTSPPYVYMVKLPKENSLTAFPYCYKIDATAKKFGLFAQLENTADPECDSHAYRCDGRTYCYGTTSPNTTLDNDGNFL